MVVGTIILYRTYAFFDEKKEFNVLKGQIPEFAENDIAIRLNGTITDKIPDKGDYNVEVACDNAEGLWNYVEWKIDIKNFDGGKIKCSLNFIPDNTNSNNLSYKSKVKDYVIMNPSLTSFSIPTNLTGYSENQEINPRELNIWRIIKIYDDGTIDMISEYVSSNSIYFSGKNGYKNYIGALNVIANSYRNLNYTKGTRYFGNNDQTEFITNMSVLDLNNNIAPWNTSTHNNNNEFLGGGDILYKEDTNLILALFGNYYAKNSLDKETNSDYWLSGRFYYYSTDCYFRFHPYYIRSDNIIANDYNLYYHLCSNNAYNDYSLAKHLRPIVTLKPNLTITEGNGTLETPWILN